jgi:hypothetical protein
MRGWIDFLHGIAYEEFERRTKLDHANPSIVA